MLRSVKAASLSIFAINRGASSGHARGLPRTVAAFMPEKLIALFVYRMDAHHTHNAGKVQL